MDEIGLAMSRAAATSRAVGISFESLGAMIAVVSEKTRQDAGSIGTALQSIMTRLANVKAKGFNEEDETKVNDVAKALNSVNIALTDGAGNWRGMDTIFMEIAEQWDSLNDKQRAYLATTMAGTRQQNVFRTLMDDMAQMNDELGESSRYVELFNGAMNSSGTAEEKFSVWQEQYSASQQRLAAEWEEFVSHMDITPLLKSLNEGLADLLGLVNHALNPSADLDPYEEAIADLEKLAELNRDNKAGRQVEFITNVAGMMGYTGDLTPEDVLEVISRVNEEYKSLRNMSADKIMAETGDGADIRKAIWSFFAPPDGTRTSEELFGEWADWVDAFDGDMAAFVAGRDFIITEKEFTDKIVLVVDKAISDATTELQSIIPNMKLPSLGEPLVKRMLIGLLGEGYSASDYTDETLSALQERINTYARMYSYMMSRINVLEAKYPGDNRTNEDYQAQRENIEKYIEHINTLFGTSFTYGEVFESMFNSLDATSQFEQNQSASIEKAQADAEELQKQVDDFYATIKQNQNTELIDSKKADGFKNEIADLQKWISVALVPSDDGTSFDALLKYYAKMANSEETKDLYKALSDSFGSAWTDLMAAFANNDELAVAAAMEEILAKSAELATKSLTDEEKAVQKWNDAVAQGVIKSQVEEGKKTGFADWVTEYAGKLKEARDQLQLFQNENLNDAYAGYDALTSEWDKMSTTEEGRQWQSAFASFFGNDFYVLIQAIKDRNVKVIEETWKSIVKKSEEGAEKAQTEWEKFVQKQKESTEKETLQAEKYGSWLTKMYEYMDAADAAGLFEWWSSQSEALREDFYQLYPALQPLLSALADDGNKDTFIETWAAQFADLRNNLPTKTDIEQIKKLNEEAKKTVRAEELQQSKKNKYSDERDTLWSYFDGNSYRQQLKALSNGNVDLTSRPVISVNDLGKAGWVDENGKPLTGDEIATMYSETFGNINAPFALTATPILPNGDVLSPKTFYEYIDELMAFDDVEKMLAYDKDHHNIVANWIAVPEGIDADGIDEFLTKYSEVGEKIHELHEAIYGASAENQTAPDINGFYAQILKWQEDGTLDALYSGVEGLELLISQMLVDMKDGTLDNVDLITKLNDLLFGTTTAWQRMGQAAKEALDNNVTDVEGVTIGRNLLQAYDQHGMEGYRAAFMALSDAEQDYVEKQFEDHNKMLAGYEEEAEAIENIREAVERLNATQAENEGTAYAGTANWMKAATDGKGFFKQLENASKAATELYDGWEGLAILSGKLTDDTEILEQAMKQLSDATGLSVETLQGPNGLQQAEAVLMGQTNQAQYTIEMFGQALADAGYIRPEWGPVMSQLRTLAADTSNVQGRVAQFILAWNEASKLGDISLALDVIGNFTAVGGGVLTALNGTDKLLNKVAQNYIAGKTTAQTKVSSSSRGGGGGGGSSKDTSDDNLKTEIEKMIHLMEQLQELYDFEQSLIQAQRKDFEQDRLIQDQIATYRQESKAIEANNAVLQANIDKIEALLPGQQALVDSMSTTDEKYKEASADLERLQSTHQKYTKQLMENRTTIKEYAEAVDDLYDKIRDMEIDLRDTILEAIKDREALEESMRDARISMEDELFDLIKKRYERERDMIIDNATKKREALKEEQNLLDENLAKRKAAAEQEDKQAELLKLQQKLIRISADPTRRADQLALQKQIAELQDELAWDEADREVEAQKESLDKQIMNLDDYIDYVKQYYEDLFEHPQKLLAEVEALMSKTDAEIIAWLKANNDEFGKSTETAQTKMVEGWESTLMQMRGDIVTYWDEVESIIQQGDDAIIEFLKTNSAKYREASQFQAEAYVDGWKEQLEDLRLAYLRTYEEISAYDYSTIRLDESSKSSSSSSSGGGGGSSKSNTTTKPTSQPINPTMKTIAGALYGLTPITASGTGKDSIKTSTGTQYYDPWSREYVSTSGTRGTGDGSTSDSKVRLNALATGSTLKNLYNQQSSTLGQVTFAKDQPVKSVVKFASGGETGDNEGLAYLHSKERVLNPYETKLFDTLVESLHRMERLSFPSMNLSSIQPEVVNNQPTFGDIVINVDSLSEDTDYDEVADKIMEVISDRMNFGRAVGGVTRPR